VPLTDFRHHDGSTVRGAHYYANAELAVSSPAVAASLIAPTH